MEGFRRKLWDRYLTTRYVHGVKVSFDEFWYDFLARHFISESGTERIFDEICKDLEEGRLRSYR